MKFLWAKIVAGITAASLGFLFLFPDQQNRELASLEQEEVLALPKESGEKPQRAYTLEKNHLYEYEFYRKVHILGLNNPFPPIEIRGKFYIQVLKDQFPKLDLVAWNDLKDHPSEKPRFRILVDQENGKVQLFSREEQSAELTDHKNILKDLVASFFYFSQEDTVGKYRAEYSVRGNDAGSGRLVIYKKNKKYELKEKNTPEVTEFLQKTEWDIGAQFPVKVAAKEKTRLGSGDYTLETDSRIWLSFQNKTLAAPLAEKELEAFINKESNQILANHIPIEQHPEYLKIDWNSILRELAKIDGLSESDKLKLFGDIVKALRLDKSRIGELLALLEEKGAIKLGAESPLYQAVVGSLATDGTKESQLTLIQIYDHPLNTLSGKGSVLGALTTTQAEAVPDTVEFLKEKADGEKDIDLRQGALFALGSAIEKKSQAPSEIEFLIQKWNEAFSSGDQDQQLAVLDAMGNSGRSEFYPVVSQQAKSSKNPQVRARSIFALRGMKIAEARSLLAGEALNQNSVLRFSAVSAIYQAQWGKDFEPSMKTCVDQEAVNSIREMCVEVLEKNKIVMASR